MELQTFIFYLFNTFENQISILIHNYRLQLGILISAYRYQYEQEIC